MKSLDFYGICQIFQRFLDKRNTMKFTEMHMLCLFPSNCFHRCTLYKSWCAFDSWVLDASNHVHSIPIRLLEIFFWQSKVNTRAFSRVRFQGTFWWEVHYFRKYCSKTAMLAVSSPHFCVWKANIAYWCAFDSGVLGASNGGYSTSIRLLENFFCHSKEEWVTFWRGVLGVIFNGKCTFWQKISENQQCFTFRPCILAFW